MDAQSLSLAHTGSSFVFWKAIRPLERWHRIPVFWRSRGLTVTVFAKHAICTPFVVEAAQLTETGWVQSLGPAATTVAPDAAHTCSTGRGRVIHFAVVAKHFAILREAFQFSTRCACNCRYCQLRSA